MWEWCADWYGNYPGGSVRDYTGAASGSNRVNRGGREGTGPCVRRGLTTREFHPSVVGVNRDIIRASLTMQVSLFTVAPGDNYVLDELNRFVRRHRVLTLDRECHGGVWSFCVTWQPPAGGVGADPAAKVDYKQVLDEKPPALFSKLREVRKALAEKENPPPCAVFTNEQLAEVARRRCATPADLGKIDGIGTARVEKYAAAVVVAIAENEKRSPAPAKPPAASANP